MNNRNLEQESNTLTGVDLIVARGSWFALVLIALGLFIVAVPFRYQQLITVTPQGDTPLVILAPNEAEWLAAQSISLTTYALYFLALETIFALVHITLGLIIYLRKPREVLGMFASLAFITFGVLVPGTSRVLDDGSGSILEVSLHLVQNIGWVTFTICFFIFPDGRFVPSWTRWFLVPFTVWAAAWLMFPLANPFNWSLPVMLIGFLFLFGCGFLAQLYRYIFVSTPMERVQTRWVLYAFGVATLGVGIFLAPGILIPETRDPGAIRVLYQMIGVAIFAFSLLLIPISIDIAILRYRLWDIDITVVWRKFRLGIIIMFEIRHCANLSLRSDSLGTGDPCIAAGLLFRER
ncbi:MAG: hypothetical protein HZB51_01330, partial [Chloroflexi bacterium]|nr:hypothetical protein [Chloroflexota bacterium]